MGKMNSVTADHVLLRLPFWPFAVVTVSLPAVSLAVCFITGFLFRFEEVNETMCEVKNYIPSISAVTGITPQTYFWRFCVGLHAAPRFAVAFIHYNYYISHMSYVKENRRSLFRKLIRLNFWLNTVENASLLGVTCISNKENYPIHEKIFIVFMVTSLCYMLCNTICFKMTRGNTLTADEEKSYYWKKAMFAGIMSATAGLLYFFVKHRVYCEPGAFSYFSACEYVIAYTNMGYHFTAYLDFKDQYWLVGAPVPGTGNGTIVNNNDNATVLSSQQVAANSNSRRRKH